MQDFARQMSEEYHYPLNPSYLLHEQIGNDNFWIG